MNTVDNPPPPPPPAESPPPREIGPQRFQRGPESVEERSLARAVGAGFALAVMVIGVPVGLLVLAGPPPIPTSLPTREDLTAAIGAEQLIAVLVWIVWLAWLQFTWCVLVELRSAMRGVGLPSRVPMAGASQRLARVLVSTVLVAATAVGQANAAVATPHDGAGGGKEAVQASAVIEATVSVADRDETSPSPAVSDQSAKPSEEAIYRLGDTVLDAELGKELLGEKVYIVQPPEGRYHDNLWDIAERTLGDGRRYHEIFELNKDREQPDGHHLSLARLIYPNWLLVMPSDATGVDTVTFEEPEADEIPVDEPAGQSGAEPAPGSDFSAEAGQDGTEGASGQAETDAAGGADASEPSFGGTSRGGREDASPASALGQNPYRDLAVGGLLAAGLLVALETARRRRRIPHPGGDQLEAEVALRIGADPDRARWFDHALRSLAHSCRERGVPLPAVYAALVDSTAVELLVAPPQAPAPEPWVADEDGRRWRLKRASLVGTQEPGSIDAPAPYPGLVSFGRDGDRDVLVDLEAAGGPISIVGDPTAAFEVATAVAVELATNQWSDHLRVTAAALPDELTVFDESRLRVVDDLADVLPELLAHRGDGAGADVLSGRLEPGGRPWMPEYLVLGSEPDAGLADDLAAVTSSASRAPVGVVCAAPVPGARWQISVDSAGNLEIPVLGLNLQANRVGWHSIEALAGLVDPERWGGGPDGPVAPEAWLPEVRPEIPDPDRTLEVAHLATAPVRVFVLGPVEVEAPNEIEPERRDLATEIVVHLALHPDGVHPTVLSGAIWPRGVTAAVRDATFERVRDWLGTAPDGSPYLLTSPDGYLVLSDDVVLDWDVVCSLLERSRIAGTPEEEIDLLRQALRVARGPVLAERPTGRYAWIARARLERTAADVLIDAAHRLSVLCRDHGGPGTAAAAARAGLRVRPGEQLLWRDLLQAQHVAEGRSGVEAAAEEMRVDLRELGVSEIESETLALLDELLPGAGGHVSSGLSDPA